ncbi:MAG: ATP-dependent Clp protease proteolytic subunit [Alphaproteobacteria bacterium]|nr:ATP-dependent Clp protease proteolytic subunit [Alphaproteobacteria bacterium]
MADNKTKANFVRDNAVFLYDYLNRETSAEMIGDLARMVNNIPTTQKNIDDTTIQSPYDINSKNPVIDVFINSYGGSIYFMNSIMTFLNIARSKGAIIRTTVTGFAASSASMIAIQGTKGFRIMYDESYHIVHYGNSNVEVSAIGEVDLVAKNEKTVRNRQKERYKRFTNMTEKEINACMRTEHHQYDAKECLNKNMCDWILTDTGTFISRNNQR